VPGKSVLGALLAKLEYGEGFSDIGICWKSATSCNSFSQQKVPVRKALLSFTTFSSLFLLDLPTHSQIIGQFFHTWLYHVDINFFFPVLEQSSNTARQYSNVIWRSTNDTYQNIIWWQSRTIVSVGTQ
jgi:hypothetical protein